MMPVQEIEKTKSHNNIDRNGFYFDISDTLIGLFFELFKKLKLTYI